MNFNTEVFIQAIRDESVGFSFGDPWRFTDHSLTCVVPILRKSKKAPGYIVLGKSKKTKILDSGSIYEVQVSNSEPLPVFIRLGEVFAGATQERTAVRSYMIFPQMMEDIEVRCVHSTRGINSGAKFESSGYVPKRDGSYTKSLFSGESVKQHESWIMDREYVSEACTYASAHQPDRSLFSLNPPFKSDDITSARDTINCSLQSVIESVPLFKDQIGVVLIDQDGFYLLDCYDLHLSWKDVKEAFLGKESLAISSSDDKSVFQYKSENVYSTIKDVLLKGFEKRVVHQNGYQVIALGREGFSGEAVIYNNNLIHLLIARN